MDKNGVAYPLGMLYAVDQKAWHTQRVAKEVWYHPDLISPPRADSKGVVITLKIACLAITFPKPTHRQSASRADTE